jgi:predicted transcriptional regulator
MKCLEIEIMHSSDALNTAIETWHQAETGKTVKPRLSFGSIKDLFSTITEKRLELLRYVAQRQGNLNTHQVAQALCRNYKNVHTDVSELEELGLIAKGEKGLLSAPYDEIVIHAGLTKAA